VGTERGSLNACEVSKQMRDRFREVREETGARSEVDVMVVGGRFLISCCEE
jgi:hypothetical protein